MEIISSAKSTILSNFPDFHQKFIYRHEQQQESNDFQVFCGKPFFVEVNKKVGLEFLRIRPDPEKPGHSMIARVKKYRMENIYSVGVPKTRNTDSSKQVAVGFCNGQIRFVDYCNSETVSNFQHDSRSSVIFLDFNCSDEHLAAVYENGLINLYGIKTKIKLETIKLDGNSTLNRFHPTKRSQLSIASYKGSAFIYDIQAKRKVFQAIECHSAPCRDLCMSLNQPDLLLTAGFDCIVNIHDVRRKLQPTQIKCQHPLSCIAISECGTYCCFGNLKGELISYDLRHLKTHLDAKKFYEQAVTRVAFVSKEQSKERESVFSQSGMYSEVDNTEKSINSNTTQILRSTLRRDSFCDFLDFHTQREQKDEDRMLSKGRYSVKFESFDWDLLNRNKGALDYVDHGDDDFPPMLQKSSTEIIKISPAKDSQIKNLNELEFKKNEPLQTGIGQNLGTSISSNKTRLSEVPEEDFIIVNKENQQQQIDTSTPNFQKNRNLENFTFQMELLKELKEMRKDFNNKLNRLEFEIKYTTESNKWQMYTQNFNFWNKQLDFNDELRNAMECLLRADSFFVEFEKLKEENDMLKRKLSEKEMKNA